MTAFGFSRLYTAMSWGLSNGQWWLQRSAYATAMPQPQTSLPK
jgi:hypothetical protein